MRPWTLLVVDDSGADRAYVQHLLRSDPLSTYRIVEADSGAAALAQCARTPPDCVLLDYQLPDMDGLQFLTQVSQQADEGAPAIVMLTGMGTERLAVEAMKRGVQDYIVKDHVTTAALVRSIRHAIEQVTTQRRLEAQQRELEQARETLEQRVQERTTELVRVNAALQTEIGIRQHAEAALRESATQYRELFEHAGDAIAIFTLDGTITDVNRAVIHLLGWSREEIVGQPYGKFTTPASGALVEERTHCFLAGEKPPAPTFEVDLVRKDGRLVQVEAHTSVLRGGDNTVIGCQGIYRDISVRKRMEHELRTLNADLERRVQERTAELVQANDGLQAKNEELRVISQQLWQTAKLATMGELAASIAHELNNPLTTVTLRVESLLRQAPPGDPKRNVLKVIEQEVERMGTLVANLLQFSRTTPQISTLDVREEIDKTLDLIHYHLRKYGIRVIREFAADAPLIRADRQQLRQVFLNLFVNASDAMPQGGTLTIRVAASQKNPQQVFTEIADTGVGIPPELAPKVTEPFVTTKQESQGTGLGLAICQRIVQEHDGTLEIFSDGVPGHGTTVRIVLPVANGKNRAYLKGTEA